MMTTNVKYIMLVDDNEHDNFFHEREIRKSNKETVIIVKHTGLEALEYLKSMDTVKHVKPDLIFLDINMPGMNGWEFLQEYNSLPKEIQSRVVIVMLTTSDNPDDCLKAKSYGFVSDYVTKPLTKEKVEEIITTHFDEEYI